MFRRTFLKHLAGAAILLVGFRELPNFEDATAPEPIEAPCGECDGTGFVFVERPQHGIVSVAEYSYLPMPDGPVTERLACPSCNSPWQKTAEATDGRKDAFEAYMTNYVQLITTKMNRENRLMFYGVA